MQLHTHHSLHFIRKLKMVKITAHIQLYYKIPFLCGNAFTCDFFLFPLFLDNSQRVLFQYYFSLSDIIKVATHVSWKVLWIKGH